MLDIKTLNIISYLFVRKNCFFFKSDELASQTSKDLNLVLLPTYLALRQNLKKKIQSKNKNKKNNKNLKK